MLTDAHWMRLEPLVEACRPKGKTAPPVHEARPASKGPSVHAHDIKGLSYFLQPLFYFDRLVLVLLARDLDASLNLADAYGREMQIRIVNALKPS